MEFQLAQQRSRGGLLIGGQVLGGQPSAALDAEQVGGRAARHQVAVQDRMHLVLQPGALPHDVRPAQHLPAQRAGLGVRHPHRRQVVGGQQLGQDRRVHLVGLHLRLGDRPGLGRVGHHHPGRPAGQHRDDRPRVPGRLQRHLIIRPQARGELPHALRRGGERARLHHPARLADRHLREVAVHIQPDAPPLCPVHLVLPPPSTAFLYRERAGETTPTDPRARRNRAGRRGGHLLTRALSPPNKTGLPTLLHSRRPCPGRSHRMPASHPRETGPAAGPATLTSSYRLRT